MAISQQKKRGKSKLKIALIITAAVIVVGFTAGMVITSVLMERNFSRGDYSDPAYVLDYYYAHFQEEYPREEAEFKSGGNTLKGFIYGKNNTKGLLVFAHGIGSGHEDYSKELLWFVDNGWRVFAYDATGSGCSEGAGTKGLPQSALDLDAALTFAENDKRLNDLPVFLMGHSWGGYAVTAVLNFDHKIAGAASIAGYAKPIDMIFEFADGLLGNFRYAAYPFMWIYSAVNYGKNANLSAVDGINKGDVPVLIIHGTNDGTIGYDNSSIINRKGEITNPNVRYITLDGATHTGMFYTKEANKYIGELNVEYRALYDKYGGRIPEDALAEFYSAADRDLINTPNEELLSQIEEFFVKNMPGNS